ncbi:MAG: cell division protein FtsX, partial [Bacteroidota bacterium]
QKYFGKLVLISIVLALPSAILIINGWLDGFAYRVSISVSVLVAASLLSVLVTTLTVMLQSFKAAMSNPVTTLKSE